jgi:hypothetical protein
MNSKLNWELILQQRYHLRHAHKIKWKLAKIIVFAFFALNSIYSKGQKTIEPNKRWIYAIGEDVPVYKISYQECLEIGNDTLVNGIYYSNLWIMNGCNYSSRILKGFIRENLSNKIFYRPFNESKEYLIYDFSLRKGDSIYLELLSSYYLIDSIEKQSVYYLHSNQKQLKWIKGIGKDDGLLYENYVGGFRLFSCCQSGGNTIYHNPNYTSCVITSNEELEKLSSKIAVFQLPDGLLNIELQNKQTSVGKLTLYMPDGREVEMVKVKLLANTEVCPPGTGLYLYRFESNTGGVQTGRVLVK